jgi:predicted transcriptional regulator
MKLPKKVVNKLKDVRSYRLSDECINNIEKLSKENKYSRGEVIEYAIAQLVKGEKN